MTKLKLAGLALALAFAVNAEASTVACALYATNQPDGPVPRAACIENVNYWDCVPSRADIVFGGQPKARRWDVLYGRSCRGLALSVPYVPYP